MKKAILTAACLALGLAFCTPASDKQRSCGDGAVKHILGEEYDIDALWREYRIAVGDIEA